MWIKFESDWIKCWISTFFMLFINNIHFLFSWRPSQRYLLWIKNDTNFLSVEECTTQESGNSKLQSSRLTHPWTGHIQLTMSEYLCPKPYTNLLQCLTCVISVIINTMLTIFLTLRFVDGASKCRFNWELPTTPFEGKLSWLGNEDNSWNENSSVGTRYSALKDFIVQRFLKDHFGAITQTFTWIYVSE